MKEGGREVLDSRSCMVMSTTTESPTGTRRSCCPTTAAALAGQEADDDAEEGDYAVDDGHKNVPDSIYDGHYCAADGSEGRFDLCDTGYVSLVPLSRVWLGRGSTEGVTERVCLRKRLRRPFW